MSLLVQKSKSFETFHNYLTLYEHGNWPTDSTTENEVHHAFNLGKSIETITDHLIKEQLFTEFKDELHCWLKTAHGITHTYSEAVFTNARDEILKKVMKQQNSSTDIAELAITKFITDCGSQRFENVLTECFLEAASYNCISDLMLEFSDKIVINLIELECELYLSKWRHNWERGKISEAKESIDKLFQNGAEKDMTVLLHALLLDQEEEVDLQIVSYVLMNFINRINENNSSYNFWNTFLQNSQRINDVCNKYPRLFEKLVNFLLHCDAEMCKTKSAAAFGVTRERLSNILLTFSKDDKTKETINTLGTKHKYFDIEIWDRMEVYAKHNQME